MDAAPDLTAPDYDAFPYPGYAYWFTHPDHLGVLGWLHGLDTAPAERCRVLELGCGDGSNLLSLAWLLPESRFVGVDLSAHHILRGAQRTGQLGLANVELVQADLTTLGPDLGTFDYIIAHGLVSWVPPHVRAATFALIGQLLAPNGVAMVSYNTYPGWHDFEPLRRLMAFHTRHVEDPADKVAQARAVARWHCARVAREAEEVKGALMLHLHSRVEQASDAIIRHDYLAEHHHCFWFEDFMAEAAAHGLAFLANARQAWLRPSNYDPELAQMLRGLPDIVRQQQYMDFLSHTRFRTTLLCRADRPLDRATDVTRLAPLFVEARTANDVWAPELRVEDPISLDTPVGPTELRGQPLRMVLSHLHHRRPTALDFDTLFAEVLPELVLAGADGGLAATEEGRAELVVLMVRELASLYFKEVVHLWRTPPPWTDVVAERPRTGPVQRLQAAEGPAVASLGHRHTLLGELERALLARLDGSRTVSELRAELGDGVDAALATLAAEGFLLR